MPTLLGPALVAAVLLGLAGAQKLLDPTMTVGALKALGLPSSPRLVRMGSAAELVLAAGAVAVGGPLLWGLVAVSYLAFALFVLAALRKGTMLGSCGCFGRDDTPPHPSHVAINIGLAAAAVAASLSVHGVPLDHLLADPAGGVVVALLGALAVYLLYAAYVELPRALAAGRTPRPAQR